MRRETFETPGEVVLDLRLPEGSIEVEAVDGTTTEIELESRGSDDEARELLDDARIDVRESQHGHEVIVHVGDLRRPGFAFWRKADLRLTIRTPPGASLRVETASADLRGRGRLGSLDAKCASGDVELDELAADAAVGTASGDVNLRIVGGAADISTASGDVGLGRVGGEVAVRTASGDIAVQDAAGAVKIRTASGDQRIGAVAAGSVELQSMSGDISVGILQGSNVWVDARAMSGDLRSELDLGESPPTDESGPLVELKASSMSGDIEVVRAPARAELTR
jgi:DUF4097 and DUF4098 domain-containing protein YvlB